MKERSLYQDEFEDLIREKTDQFKMYPSDKVWKEVYGSLHTKRKRFIAGMSVLITAILILAGKQLLSPAKNNNSRIVSVKNVAAALPANISAFGINTELASSDEKISASKNTIPFILESRSNANDAISSKQIIEETLVKAAQPDVSRKMPSPANSNINHNAIVSDIATDSQEVLAKVVYHDAENGLNNLDNNRSVKLLSHIKDDRFSWELYVTPTLNVRRLSGVDYSAIRSQFSNSPIALIQFGNINDFDHSPAIGYEIGGSLIYKLSKIFSVKAGLQFGYSRYFIKAYPNGSQLSTLQMGSYLGYIPDSLNGNITGNPRNSGSKGSQSFQNRYYEFSVPVGVDMKVAGSGRFQVHVGATIQPSYLLNKSAYVISNDYSSYQKDPSAFRRWNLNAGLETFISYKIGSFRWQIGPQFRYQLLSTYKSSYPLRENLLNYGIKIGFSKTIW